MENKKRKQEEEPEEPNWKYMKVVNNFVVPITCQEEKLFLAIKNWHPRDSLITFAEEILDSEDHHKYFIRGEKDYCSVSGFYKQFFEDFQNVTTATNMINRSDFWLNEKYKEYWNVLENKTNEDSIEIIVKMWNDNGILQSQLGKVMHRKLELFLNNDNQELYNDPEKEISHFLQFYKDYITDDLHVFRTEMMMFDDESKLCGCADVIFIEKSEEEYIPLWQSGKRKLKVFLGDWKRSKCISKTGYNKWAKKPCQSLPDCNFSKYSLQLNLYKYLLEKNYDLIVQNMTIYVFHPNNDSYLDYEVKDYQFLIHQMIAKRIEANFEIL
jgi:hypothetical protein